MSGINVGGGGKLPMAEFRALLTGVGLGQVAAYVQSENAGFTSEEADPRAIAARVESEVAARSDVAPTVLVLTAAQLRKVIARNP